MFISNYLEVIKSMMESKNKKIVDDWVSSLYLKNYLATCSVQQLCELVSDFNFFQSFLYDCSVLFREEPVFLLLDDIFLEKISDVVNSNRFSFYEKAISELSNEVIIGVNDLSCMSDYIKQSRIINYLLFQEEYRKRQIDTIDKLIEVNINDFVAFTGIKDGKQYLSTFDVLSSLNYFTYICPECFQDSDFYSNTLSFLDSCCKVSFYRKMGKDYRYAIRTKKAIQKVKKS